MSIDAAVGIAAKSPQKAVSALIKRAEKQLLDSSRDLMEPEAERTKVCREYQREYDE